MKFAPRKLTEVPIQTINEVVDEMLALIRERMRMSPEQAALLAPVVRRAVHQIARKLELQPIAFSADIREAVGQTHVDRAIQWVEDNFGPGYVQAIPTPKGGATRYAIARPTLLAMVDEMKAKNGRKDAQAEIGAMAGALGEGGALWIYGTERGKYDSVPEEALNKRTRGQRARREREKQAKQEQKT